MAKNKKAASGSSSLGKKKATPATSKKLPKKEIDTKKVEIINEKVTKMNKRFELILSECQNALKELTKNNHENVLS